MVRSVRDRAILIGLFLSKFDKKGIEALGFSNFSEAFNTLGLSIGAKPASLKNYRDEFDPLFPNKRMGWHKRYTASRGTLRRRATILSFRSISHAVPHYR